MAGVGSGGCCNDISQITLQIYLVVQAGCQDGAASIAQRRAWLEVSTACYIIILWLTGRNVVMPWVIHYRLENFEHLRNVESSFSDCLHIMKCYLASYKCSSRQLVEDKFQALMVDDGEIFRNWNRLLLGPRSRGNYWDTPHRCEAWESLLVTLVLWEGRHWAGSRMADPASEMTLAEISWK